MRYKYMTNRHANEINELWSNGHAEALTSYGMECVNAWRKGFARGTTIAIITGAISVVGTVAAIGVIGLVSELVEEKRDKKTDEAVVEEE